MGGRYWTAIDMVVGPDDADVLAEECDYIFARASQYEIGISLDPADAIGDFGPGESADPIEQIAAAQLASPGHRS